MFRPLATLLLLALGCPSPALAAAPAAEPTPGRPDGEGQVRGALPRAGIAVRVPGLSLAGDAVPPAMQARLQAAVRTLWHAQRPDQVVADVSLAPTWQELLVMVAEGGRRVCKTGWRLPVRVTTRDAAGATARWRAMLLRDGEDDRVMLRIDGSDP
jgi:hypothetical protein